MEHRLIIPTEARELIYHLHRVLYGLNELILAQINRNGHLTSKVTQILFFLTTKFCSGLFVGIVNRCNMSDSYWCWKLSHRRIYVPYNKYLLLNLCMLMIFSFKKIYWGMIDTWHTITCTYLMYSTWWVWKWWLYILVNLSPHSMLQIFSLLPKPSSCPLYLLINNTE